MMKIKLAAIALFILSIAVGAAFGLIIPNDQPPNQTFSFVPQAVHSVQTVGCTPSPKNYSNWLEIHVLGNRTGINFQTVTVYSSGYNIRIDLPLNRTSFAVYRVYSINNETIYVGLPSYFNGGDVIQLSVTYFISGYALRSVTLTEVPLLLGEPDC